MKKILLSACVAVLSVGCVSTSVERGDFKAKQNKWWWQTDELKADIATKPDGSVTASVHVKKSGVNADALGAAVDKAIDRLENATKP